MKDFDSWFKELCSEYTWYQPASMAHRPETFRKVANQVWMEYNATGFPSIAEARRHVYYKIVKLPGDNQKVNWSKQALEKQEAVQVWKPADPEHVDKCVREFHQMLLNSPMMKRAPRLTEEEKIHFGDWEPATIEPRTPVQQAMIIQEHVRKVKTARAKLYLEHFPNATSEEVEAYVNKFSDL
jgi:hypothetical protein